MPLATLLSRASSGMDAPLITIEVHLTKGIPSLSIVGLPETAIKESKDRVRCAIINSGFDFPLRRITINLAPADLPKREGGRFDLPIALAILIASSQLTPPLKMMKEYEFAGELGLNGELRFFPGSLPFSLASSKVSHTLIVPTINAYEAALVKKSIVLPANHLLDVCNHLLQKKELTAYKIDSNINLGKEDSHLNISEIYGQQQAKRALEIAAAGSHSLLLKGPPGTGKTMLAERLITILPHMSEKEALETATITSLLGKKIDIHNWRKRPFRAPHHSASSIALVGGSSPPKPGEVSLAHNGVLFLDELPEFSRKVLETLREPLESGHITISRAAHQACFPSRIQLIAAMNPCPCGNSGDKNRRCKCTERQIQSYQDRISGPFLDRIDLHVAVPMLPKHFLRNKNKKTEENSTEIKKRVIAAREIALKRANKLNAHLSNSEIKKFCALTSSDQDYFIYATEKLNLSVRSLNKMLKLARTIADLDHKENIAKNHLSEALNYRAINN